jgi:hypothetical protein
MKPIPKWCQPYKLAKVKKEQLPSFGFESKLIECRGTKVDVIVCTSFTSIDYLDNNTLTPYKVRISRIIQRTAESSELSATKRRIVWVSAVRHGIVQFMRNSADGVSVFTCDTTTSKSTISIIRRRGLPCRVKSSLSRKGACACASWRWGNYGSYNRCGGRGSSWCGRCSLNDRNGSCRSRLCSDNGCSGCRHLSDGCRGCFACTMRRVGKRSRISHCFGSSAGRSDCLSRGNCNPNDIVVSDVATTEWRCWNEQSWSKKKSERRIEKVHFCSAKYGPA